MKRLLRRLLISAGTVGVSSLALYMIVLSSTTVREVSKFERRFSTAAIGDNKTEVIDRLGKPDDFDADFRLGQLEGHEDAYEQARKSGATQFLFWIKGIDVVFAVGFDENDKVVLAEYGGT